MEGRRGAEDGTDEELKAELETIAEEDENNAEREIDAEGEDGEEKNEEDEKEEEAAADEEEEEEKGDRKRTEAGGEGKAEGGSNADEGASEIKTGAAFEGGEKEEEER